MHRHFCDNSFFCNSRIYLDKFARRSDRLTHIRSVFVSFSLVSSVRCRKNPKNLDTQKITVITLKLEKYCFTTE